MQTYLWLDKHLMLLQSTCFKSICEILSECDSDESRYCNHNYWLSHRMRLELLIIVHTVPALCLPQQKSRCDAAQNIGN